MNHKTKEVTDIFFDLDRTLWDFEINSKVTLEFLYREYKLDKYIDTFPLFYRIYKEENNKVWEQYYKKEIDKSAVRLLRFKNTLRIKDLNFCDILSNKYIEICMHETALLPHTKAILTYLYKSYNLHIISNGFKEVQNTKLENCNIKHFFKTITTSEDAGFHKPSKEAFIFAMKQAQTSPEKSAMVGDDLNTDIAGANNANMLSIFFNSNKINQTHKANIEINSLDFLTKIF